MNDNRIIIVGGGASGTILATHLLHSGAAGLRVAIVERRAVIGAGIAYSTDEPDHLLNTRASGMSAFPKDPNHFWRWLVGTSHAQAFGCDSPYCFVPRLIYREYLSDLVAPFSGPGGRLALLNGECTDIQPIDGGVAVTLADGRIEIADLAVLATGHVEPCARTGSRVIGPWCRSSELPVAPDDAVVILGTGLSMVDNVATLRRKMHRGTIIAISRRGLLPQPHAPSVPLPLDAADVPFGTAPSYIMRWLRRTVRWAAASENRGWWDVVDALRPHTQYLWRSLTPEGKQSFLRHARTLWEVHRHRMAPLAAEGLRADLSAGRLQIVAGRVVETTEAGSGVVVRLRERGAGSIREIRADWVIDCMGILRDPASGSGRLAARLIENGRARLDPLQIGLDVAEGGEIVDAQGQPSERLYAVGPVTRARSWEVTAIPEIRLQCSELATQLVQRLSSATKGGAPLS